MKEKSGLDMLEELLYEVKRLRKELKVLDHKVAQIANSTKVVEIVDKVMGTKFEDWGRSKPKAVAGAPKPKAQAAVAPVKGIKNFNFEVTDAAKIEQEPVARRGRGEVSKPTLVSGKMITELNGKTVALSGLKVKVYNEKDTLVKETKTNRAGKWMSHLTPGRYVANIEGKYKNKDLVPINLMFEVKAGMKSLEVN